MIRKIIDRDDGEWIAEENGGSFGVGARDMGETLPKATIGTVRFTSADGRTVTRQIATGTLPQLTDEALLNLLEEEDE
ncbi:hypothetical protein ACFL4Q_04885 [candidate division KSB1 bacterium]